MSFAYSDTPSFADAAFEPSWQDHATLRWLVQLAHGVIPGVLIVWAVLQLAGQPVSNSAGPSCAASVVPMLGLASGNDVGTFHRYSFDHNAPADVSPKFRLPDPDRRDPSAVKHTLTVTKRVSALPVKFDAPRQSWDHLSRKARGDIDAGLKASAQQQWQRVVLHGSGARAGSAGLLDRYHRDVQRQGTGLAYHFVIGNGSRTADGEVEASARWLAGGAAGDSADPGLAGGISICLVGDFHVAPPTPAQLAALDELMDYLAVKIGSVPVTTHHHLTGNDRSCLGAKFPEEAVLKALAAER